MQQKKRRPQLLTANNSVLPRHLYWPLSVTRCIATTRHSIDYYCNYNECSVNTNWLWIELVGIWGSWCVWQFLPKHNTGKTAASEMVVHAVDYRCFLPPIITFVQVHSLLSSFPPTFPVSCGISWKVCCAWWWGMDARYSLTALLAAFHYHNCASCCLPLP